MGEYPFGHYDVPFFTWLDEDPLIARNVVRDANNVHNIEFDVASGLEIEFESIPAEANRVVYTPSDPSTSIERKLWADVRALFSKEDGVVEVWAELSDDSVYILTLIESFDWEISERIYQIEKNLINLYYDLGFDFNILALEGEDSSEIVSDLDRIFP